jgi:thioredoxin 2
LPAAAPGSPRCGGCQKALPWITDAGDATFAEIAEAASMPVVVNLWAPWCGPCRRINPALADMATEMAGLIKLVTVSVPESPRLVRRLRVLSVPTLIILRRAEVIARQAGVVPEYQLRAWLTSSLPA